MLELEAALEQIVRALPSAQHETVPLGAAPGRYVAEGIVSPIDLPGFDNSSMDGYAVRSTDVARASAATPVSLKVIGKLAAGNPPGAQVSRGTCVRLFTGSALPEGADAVVMQEDTRVDDRASDTVHVLDSAKPFDNVRLRGEDIKQGVRILASGDLLTSTRICLLAALGLGEVKVGRRPAIGVLATGSELRESGQSLGPGQIYESNRAGIAALAQKAGAIPRIFPLVPDSPGATRSAMEEAFRECDMIITSGGVSVGEMDFVKQAFEEMGGKLEFWRVAIKPGKPFVFGHHRGKFLFGLPGNPVSALVTFLLLVRPAILRWQGARDVALTSHSGVLTEILSNPGNRRHFVRVRVEAGGEVCASGVQASHMLSSLAAANGLVDVPPATVLAAGSTIQVLRWE